MKPTQNFEYQHELEFRNEAAERVSQLGIRGVDAPAHDSDDSFSDDDMATKYSRNRYAGASASKANSAVGAYSGVS